MRATPENPADLNEKTDMLTDINDPNSIPETRVPSAFKTMWLEIYKDKVALVGLVLFLGIMLTTFIWSAFIDQSQAMMTDLMVRNTAPSPEHPWGTDEVGREMMELTVLSARNTIIVGFGITLFAAIVGLTVGLISGFKGGHVDNVIMRITDTWMMLPFLMIVIVITTIIDGYSTINFIMVLAAFSWMGTARILRSVALQQSNLDYIHASKTLGTPNTVIMLRELLPNLVPVITVQYTLALAVNIIAETTLTFLGFGLPFGTPSLGRLIAHAQVPAALQFRMWQWLPSTLLILVILLCVFSVGLALNRASNVRQRRG